MHIFAQMIEVQADGVQVGEMFLHLVANPHRAIDVGDSPVRKVKPQSAGLATHQLSRRAMIASGQGHVLTLGALITKVGPLALPSSMVASRFRESSLTLA